MMDFQSGFTNLPNQTRKKNFTVAVEGNIGSGKSTLLRYFNNCNNVNVIPEPVHLWKNVHGHNLLDLMYKDASRWSMVFQSYVQLTMLNVHCSDNQNKHTKLMERSLYSARYCFVENLYQGGKLSEVEYSVLDEWFSWMAHHMNLDLDLIIYLRTRPEVCQKRIIQRNEREEAAIPLAYLQSLHHLHEDWLIHETMFKKPCPVLVLNADCNLSEMQQKLDLHQHQILPSAEVVIA